MNLREQIEKEITDKVMTKLASEKVELGAIQDLQADIQEGIKTGNLMKDAQKNAVKKQNELISAAKKFNSLTKEVNLEVSGIKTFRDNTNADYRRASKLYEKILKQSLDLGLDMPKKIEQQFKTLEEFVNWGKKNIPKKLPIYKEIDI